MQGIVKGRAASSSVRSMAAIYWIRSLVPIEGTANGARVYHRQCRGGTSIMPPPIGRSSYFSSCRTNCSRAWAISANSEINLVGMVPHRHQQPGLPWCGRAAGRAQLGQGRSAAV